MIAAALAFGLLSLALPFGVFLWAPDSEFMQRPRAKVERRSTLVRNPRSADLRGERLAFMGNCAVGEFKDRREIEASIVRQFSVYRLSGLTVAVTEMCIAELHGEVHSARERDEALRAAGHPWVRAIDVADLRVVESPAPPQR